MIKYSKSLLVVASLAATAALAACPGGKGLPGKPNIPGSDKVPGGVPGVGPDASLDPNACGGYASSDAGRKLKAFLEATQAVEKSLSVMAMDPPTS